MIINTLIKLKASGLAEGTLRNVSYQLAKLDKLADLTHPNAVKLAIAELPNANSYKHNLVKAYHYFATLNEIEWTRPTYRRERKLPTIPT